MKYFVVYQQVFTDEFVRKEYVSLTDLILDAANWLCEGTTYEVVEAGEI